MTPLTLDHDVMPIAAPSPCSSPSPSRTAPRLAGAAVLFAVTTIGATLLAPAGAAQLPPLPTQNLTRAMDNGGVATLAVAGTITGTGYPDVVQVVDGVPWLFPTPALNQGKLALPGTWYGVTGLCLRRPGPGPTRQQILLSDETTLRLCVVDAELGLVMIPLPIPGFDGASWLSAHDLDGDTHEDLLVLDRTRAIVRVLPGAASGIGEPRSVALGATAGAVASVRFAGGRGERQVVVAIGSSLQAYAQSLTGQTSELATSSYTVTIGLSPIAASGGGEHLVWATSGAAGGELVVCDGTAATAVALPGRDLVAMAVGDIDGDGDDDVVLSQRNHHRALVLVQSGNGFAFPSGASEIPLIAEPAAADPAPENVATPVLGDLEMDGDADVVHAVQSIDALTVALSLPVNTDDEPVTLLGAQDTGQTMQDTVVALQIEPLPAGLAATHVEVLAWRLEHSPTYAYVPEVALRNRIPVSQQGPLILPLSSQATNESFNALFIGQRDPYLLWVRAVIAGPEGVLYAYPPRVLMMAAIESDWMQLETDFPEHVATQGIVHVSQDGGVVTGGYIELPLPPPPPPPDPPPPPPQDG